MSDNPHLVRLIKGCRLMATDGLTLQQLRGKLKVSRRTMFRYLSELDEMGIPVELKSKQYRVRTRLAECRRRITDAQVRELNRLLDAHLK